MTNFMLTTTSTCGVLVKGNKHCPNKPAVLVRGLTKDGEVVMCSACIKALRRRKSRVLYFTEHPLPELTPEVPKTEEE
jgi:hypothetical protein